MLFSLLKHYLELYITNTALKVSRSVYCFATSISHGVENYFPRLWGMGMLFYCSLLFLNIRDTYDTIPGMACLHTKVIIVIQNRKIVF